ncbi:zinc-ribbon domain containing protein [Tepidiforma sp.]|uniref:zinc-ribbon domain containing protein n=1 Tax=Tepidiforma sp. TaxID=2682230 RepID=UPI0034DFF23D
MSYSDKLLVCVDCSESFTFTAGEQEFHASKGFTQEPRRCPTCRRARKGQHGSGIEARAPRQLYDAVCASCGKPAKVPFEPRNGRPVYCSDCFQPQPRGLAAAGGRGPAPREPRQPISGAWNDFEPFDRGGGRGGRSWSDRKGNKGRRW